MANVAVVGAGIAGLPTAVEIQKLEPRAKVTLIAERFSPHITSDIAAGFWNPVYLDDDRTDLIKRWGADTFALIEGMAKEDPYKYGASMCSGYLLSGISLQSKYEEICDIARDVSRMKPSDIRKVSADPVYRHGVFFTSAILESTVYLKHLMHLFQQNGGTVAQRRLDSLGDAALSGADVIVNCTGLGARSLLADDAVHPIRGQVFRVRAPFIKHWYILQNGDIDRYVLPNLDTVVIGGTHTANDWNTAWSETDARDIWNDVADFLPSLNKSEVVARRVGLRPGRRGRVRVESEVARLHADRKPQTVVHNYGHGGSGLTLFQGCAKDAARMTVDAVHGGAQKSKL